MAEGKKDEIEKMEKILKNIRYFDQDSKMENFIARLEARMKFYDIKKEENKKILLQNLIAGTPTGKITELKARIQTHFSGSAVRSAGNPSEKKTHTGFLKIFSHIY